MSFDSDTMSVSSDTMSDDSDTCDISDELQQDLQEALTQYQQVEQLQSIILEKLSHLRASLSDTIYVVSDEYKNDLDSILTEIHEEAIKQVETTGHHSFGSMLLATLENAEFKYSTSMI